MCFNTWHSAQPTVTRQTPVSALIDGGGGLGHANARRAMELDIDKAKSTGIGVTSGSGNAICRGFSPLVSALTPIPRSLAPTRTAMLVAFSPGINQQQVAAF